MKVWFSQECYTDLSNSLVDIFQHSSSTVVLTFDITDIKGNSFPRIAWH